MNPFKIVTKPFTMLAGKVYHDAQTKVTMSIVRHCVTLLGGELVRQGLVDMSKLPELVGALMVLISVGSGIKQKLQEHKK